MKIVILFLILIFAIMPVQAQTRVYIEGNLNYNGEYTKPEIIMSDPITKKEYDAVPELTLSDLIVNIGGFKKNSDFRNIMFIRNDECEYLDFTDKTVQKTVLKDGDKIIVNEDRDMSVTEKSYVDFVKNDYYQNTVLISLLNDKQNEIMQYTANLKDIISQLVDNKDFAGYKIFIKRPVGNHFEKIKIKTVAEVKIFPNDIIYISALK